MSKPGIEIPLFTASLNFSSALFSTAVRQSGRKDVQVIGLSLPNLCKPYVDGGEIEAVALWNTKDLGYLAVAAPAALARGTLSAGAKSFSADRLGKVEIKASDIILGSPLLFHKDNIDQLIFKSAGSLLLVAVSIAMSE